MGAKLKLLQSAGLAALAGKIKTAQKDASDSSAAVLDVAQALADSVEEVNGILLGKQDINPAAPFTIPIEGWGTDETVADFPNYLDITVDGLLETDIVTVTVLPGSCAAAQEAAFCSVESMDGAFRLRAKNVPEAEISAQYHIVPTAAYSAEEGA